VDVLFLDIQLGGTSGIDLLQMARPSGAVILTTAFDAYALQGYDLNVTDYLLKPYTFERFLQAVGKALVKVGQVQEAPQTAAIFVKTEYRLERVELSDLLYIEGMRDYRRLHLIDKKIMTLQTFGHFEQEIPSHLACRVHKSYMVSLSKIEAIERDRIRIGAMHIPVSDTYKAGFMERLRNRMPDA
jgi:DNA-binding LytR/AlgR family response regulator